MARDDLHVIVYQILSYLNQQMKEGREVDEKKIDEHAFRIPRSYWTFIMSELHSLGYAKGYSDVPLNGGGHAIEHLERARITFKGVEYLTDDAFMKKVREERE